MQRLRLSDVQNSRLPASVGRSGTDQHFIDLLNEAQQRLLTKGLWWGTVARFSLACYDGCITLPPAIAGLESAALCRMPVPIRDQWFEFMEFGFGTRTAAIAGQSGSSYWGYGVQGLGIPEAIYRGQFPVFRDLPPDGHVHKLVVVCDLAADNTAGITMIVTGWDAGNNWIRTTQGASLADGEAIALAQSPGTTSTNNFSRIGDIQFSGVRSGQCWLYDSDTTASTLTMIGHYEWWETAPSYGRWFLPSVPLASATQNAPAAWQQDWRATNLPEPAAGFTPAFLEVMAKLDFKPVANPNDYLIIQSLPALKFMLQAVNKEEDCVGSGDLQEAIGFEAKAVAELDDQLNMYLGSGRRIGVSVVGSDVTGDPIETLI